jgi:hypothetical protein
MEVCVAVLVQATYLRSRTRRTCHMPNAGEQGLLMSPHAPRSKRRTDVTQVLHLSMTRVAHEPASPHDMDMTVLPLSPVCAHRRLETSRESSSSTVFLCSLGSAACACTRSMVHPHSPRASNLSASPWTGRRPTSVALTPFAWPGRAPVTRTRDHEARRTPLSPPSPCSPPREATGPVEQRYAPPSFDPGHPALGFPPKQPRREET